MRPIARSLASFLVIATLVAGGSAAQAQLPAKVGDTPVPSLAPMIKKVSPTVVSIGARGTVKARRNPLLEDPFFRRFFEGEPGPREREFESTGSGVVIDAKAGYIITNAHVVANAKEIAVTTQDNRRFTAEVLGADEGSDVAVLKIKEKDAALPSITLGDSSRVEVGDFVVAIGNPFGLQHTVTSGIISALGRSGINPDGYEDFIQTDASINPGNSGGALVNLKGELVGINSAIFSASGGNIGIGFAIPVNMVKNVMDQLIEFGEVRRGILGVNIVTLTPDLIEGVGVPANTHGALVSQVVEGSAAEKAGIKINDVITAVNGQQVKGGAELKNAIGMLRVGDKVEVSLLRDGKPRKVTALIGESSATQSADATTIHRGLAGVDLDDSPDGSGVVVSSVEPGSPAAQSGLRPNDIILEANRRRVENVRQLREVTQATTQGTSALILSVRRGGTVILVPVR